MVLEGFLEGAADSHYLVILVYGQYMTQLQIYKPADFTLLFKCPCSSESEPYTSDIQTWFYSVYRALSWPVSTQLSLSFLVDEGAREQVFYDDSILTVFLARESRDHLQMN